MYEVDIMNSSMHWHYWTSVLLPFRELLDAELPSTSSRKAEALRRTLRTMNTNHRADDKADWDYSGMNRYIEICWPTLLCLQREQQTRF